MRIGLLGANGRMGRTVTRILAEESPADAVLAASCSRGDDLSHLCDADVIIDFSTPEGTLGLLDSATGVLPPLACGVTGWQEAQTERLHEHASRNCILLAANFSTGVLALRHILRSAAPLLAHLGYTPVITEAHHRHKRDAPSGTALALCRDIAPSEPETIQTHAIRAGEVIGEHQVTFFGASDRIVLAHQAQDRGIFARGAIEAALWLGAQPQTPGLLSMNDYLEDQITAAAEVSP